MKKKGVWLVLAVSLILVSLSFSLVSASWFGDFWGKVTGNVISGDGSGLMLYSSFDGNANDLSGNNVNGVLMNGVDCNSTGIIGKACSFDGIDDYIDYGRNLNPSVLNAYTISIWFYNNGQGSYYAYGQKLFAKGDMYSDFYSAMSTDGSMGFGWGVMGVSKDLRKAWHHLVIIKDGINGQMWMDGVLSAKSGKMINYSNPSKNFMVGYTDHGDSYQRTYWNGLVDELRIYNRALSESEVKELYVQGGNSSTPAPVVTCSDSDGGMNYNVRGNITGLELNPYDDLGYPVSYLDTCNSAGTRLTEYFCDPTGLYIVNYSVVAYDYYYCPNGCSNGACVNQTTPQPNVTCSDSDGGLNYYVEGTINYFYNTHTSNPDFYGSHIAQDQCMDNGSLLENSCTYYDPYELHPAKSYTCPNGCKDGACIRKNLEILKIERSNNLLNLYENITSIYTSVSDSELPLYFRDIDNSDFTYTQKITLGNIYLKNFTDKDYEPGVYYLGMHLKPNTEIISYTLDFTKVVNFDNSLIGKSLYLFGKNLEITGFINSPTNKSLIFKSLAGEKIIIQDDSSVWVNGYRLDSLDPEFVFLDDKLDAIKIRWIVTDESFLTEKTDLILPYFGNLWFDFQGMSYNSQNEWYANLYLMAQYDDLAQPVQVCQPLIDKVKNPASFTDSYGIYYMLTQNDTWKGSWYGSYPYTEYTAGWNANQDNQHYYQYLSVVVFDDANFKASTLLDEITSYTTCVERQFSGKTVYVCNWNPMAEDSNAKEIMWVDNNVLVRDFVLNNPDQLTEEQIEKIYEKNIAQFVQDLKSNELKPLYESFDIQGSLLGLVDSNLDKCSSEIKPGNLPYSYSCKIEPVICPEHGFQTETCNGWANNENVIRTSQRYCSPGICSGCMTPRWLGGSDNKCIPYGFRFELESGYTNKIYENQIIEEIITENGFDATFEIRNDGTAYAKINSDIDLSNITNGEISSVEMYIDGKTYYGKAGEELVIYPGYHQLDITYYDSNGNKIYSGGAQVEISKIVYNEDSTKAYIEIRNRYNYPAYCDIDGWVKQQKNKQYDGEWAKCQNNYECASNICSYGECVEVKDMFAEVNAFKGTFVRVVCKLSNLFSQEDYGQCVYEYLGEGSTSSSSSGGSGGSSA